MHAGKPPQHLQHGNLAIQELQHHTTWCQHRAADCLACVHLFGVEVNALPEGALKASRLLRASGLLRASVLILCRHWHHSILARHQVMRPGRARRLLPLPQALRLALRAPSSSLRRSRGMATPS